MMKLINNKIKKNLISTQEKVEITESNLAG